MINSPSPGSWIGHSPRASFAIFCSRPTKLPDAYLRYLENALREDFDLPGTPIRLTLRKGENPYAPKK